jgi:hypothetical protein
MSLGPQRRRDDAMTAISITDFVIGSKTLTLREKTQKMGSVLQKPSFSSYPFNLCFHLLKSRFRDVLLQAYHIPWHPSEGHAT